MSQMIDALKQGLPRLGLELEESVCQQLCSFGQAVIEQNKVMNLTAITEPSQVAKLHLLDSISLLAVTELAGKRIVDVGCGAGFPGVPVKIACPGADVTLLDSLGKRMAWLERILPELGVEATCVTARAEEAVLSCREQYDLATSRAVARLNILAELCLPYVKVGGYFLALKGAMTTEEVDEAAKAIAALGGKVRQIYEYPAADAIHRIVVVEKVRPTPKQYPRPFAKIKKNPL